MCISGPVPRFLVDLTVRRLGRWMRLAGWDVEDAPDWPMPRLLHRARREGRVFLSRSPRAAFDGFVIRAERVDDQLREVAAAFPKPVAPLIVCAACNSELLECDRVDARDRVPAYVWSRHRRFSRCPSCGRVYWVGTHVRRILGRLRDCGLRWTPRSRRGGAG